MSELTAPAAEAVAVDVSASDQTVNTRGLWVGGAGNVKVDMKRGGAGVTFSAVPAGTLLPFRITKIYNSGTTATLMVALN